MPAWRDHAAGDRAALVVVVQGFSAVPDSPQPSADDLALGQAVYAANCIECHGEAGDGNGFAADQFPVRPTDFRVEQPGFDESVRVLRNGVPGTSMAVWTDRLDGTEINAAAHYIRQFYEGDRP